MTEGSFNGLYPQYQTYVQQKCFVSYSEKARWSVDLLSACEEILGRPEYNLEIDYASKHLVPGITLRQKALELIANARYGIYDISCWCQAEEDSWHAPRNVMIELGIAIALNRPTLLLRHASNRDLPLPESLHCVSDQILEFSGKTTLKNILVEHLPEWINALPENAWWNRYCVFGQKKCEYREAYPKVAQSDNRTLNCVISDGADVRRDDFRGVVDDILARFSDVTYIYLDSLPPEEHHDFTLCNHCQATRSSALAIYKVTSKTPVEAFISIGINIALEAQFECEIPKILITEASKTLPSILSGYEAVVVYTDRDTKLALKKFLPKVIQNIRKIPWKKRILPFIEKPLSSSLLFEAQEPSTESTLEETQEADLSEKSDKQPKSLSSESTEESKMPEKSEDNSNSSSSEKSDKQSRKNNERSSTSSARKKKRLNLDLTIETYELLQRLASESGKNMAEILRSGLALYGISQEEIQKGNALGVVEGEKIVKEIVVS